MDCAKAGRLIRTLRLERGLTQAELVEVLCVSPKTVSKWENGCSSSSSTQNGICRCVLNAGGAGFSFGTAQRKACCIS